MNGEKELPSKVPSSGRVRQDMGIISTVYTILLGDLVDGSQGRGEGNAIGLDGWYRT